MTTDSQDNEKFKIEFKDEFFLDAKKFINEAFAGEEILSSTEPIQDGGLLLPSLYLIPNKDISIQKNLAIPGLMVTIFSFTNKIAFCFQLYEKPYVELFNPAKNYFFPFITIARADIKAFQVQDKRTFLAVKPKMSDKFYKKATYISALSNRSGFIGGLIMQLATAGISKIIDKSEDETIEKNGSMFNLNCSFNNKDFTISIASESIYSGHLEYFLKKHWTNEIPKPHKEPETKEERRQLAFEILKISDEVLIPRFFGYDRGTIIEKEKESAKIKIITKDGKEEIKNVDYLKLTRIKDKTIF